MLDTIQRFSQVLHILPFNLLNILSQLSLESNIICIGWLGLTYAYYLFIYIPKVFQLFDLISEQSHLVLFSHNNSIVEILTAIGSLAKFY